MNFGIKIKGSVETFRKNEIEIYLLRELFKLLVNENYCSMERYKLLLYIRYLVDNKIKLNKEIELDLKIPKSKKSKKPTNIDEESSSEEDISTTNTGVNTKKRKIQKDHSIQEESENDSENFTSTPLKKGDDHDPPSIYYDYLYGDNDLPSKCPLFNESQEDIAVDLNN